MVPERAEVLVGVCLKDPWYADGHGPRLSDAFQQQVMGLDAGDFRATAARERHCDRPHACLFGGRVVLQQPTGHILQLGSIAAD